MDKKNKYFLGFLVLIVFLCINALVSNDWKFIQNILIHNSFCLLLTIIVECLVFVLLTLFSFKSKCKECIGGLFIISVVNCFTNPIANYLYNIINFSVKIPILPYNNMGMLLIFILIEIGVFITEWLLLWLLLPKRLKLNPALVSFLINIPTIIISLIYFTFIQLVPQFILISLIIFLSLSWFIALFNFYKQKQMI